MSAGRRWRGGAFVLAVVSVAAVARPARADEGLDAVGGLDADRLGIRARVAIPVAVLSYEGGPDRPAGGLLFALGARGLSRFTRRERGLVFEDSLDVAVAASPFRGVSTGAGFGWRYGAELGVRTARSGLLAGASVDTMAWAFSSGPTFTSASVPISLRLEQKIGSDMRVGAGAFVTVLPFGARRDGGELRVELVGREGHAREAHDAHEAHGAHEARDAHGAHDASTTRVLGEGLASVAFYVQGSDTSGVARVGAMRTHASVALVEIGVVETFR